MNYLIIGLMIVIMVGGMLALREDAKQRRVNRQVANALGSPVAPTVTRPRFRRQSSRHRLLASICGYRSDAPHGAMIYTVLIAIAMAGATIMIGQMMVSLGIAIATGVVVCIVVIRSSFTWQKNRYADKLLRQMPDCIELIISAVKAGLPVAEAFQTAAREMSTPTREQFTIVTQEMSLGRSTEEAVRSVYDRVGVAEYAILSVTIAVQSKAGGRLAETLQTLAETIRERVALAGRSKALAGEAKLSARVLASLPFAAGTLLYLERPESMNPLFYNPNGRFLFAIGLSSLLMGIITMRYMIRKGTSI